MVVSLLCVFGSFINIQGQSLAYQASQDSEQWVDSVYQSLSLKEKVAQLVFVRANYSGQKTFIKEVDKYVKNFNVGGVAFFRGSALAQAQMTNHWNRMAKTPLMVTMDAEWGIGMRLNGTVKYPLQMTLGAVTEDSLIYQMGREIAWQCKRMGIHMNFAPVVDVNNNPANPVIGMRSFGSIPTAVGEKAALYMQGMQDEGVLACAKHFPGHGNTRSDSHKTLPVVTSKMKNLRKVEFVPFQYLIDKGVTSVMVAHLSVPAIDKSKNKPTSLSSKVIEKQLIKKMGFQGLVVTDALDMKGVTKYYDKGEVALLAFKAGNDILLMPDDVEASINSIVEKLESGKIKEERLERSCKKILRYKYFSGAWQRQEVDTSHLMSDLNQTVYEKTVHGLGAQAITVVKNDDNLLPLAYPDTLKPALLIIGDDKASAFEQSFHQVFKPVVVRLKHDASIMERQRALEAVQDNNLIIVGLLNTNISASRKFGISDGDIQFVEHLSRRKAVVLDVFASPYALNYFNGLDQFKAVIVSYQDKVFYQKYSAEIILGMRAAHGKLPVDVAGMDAGSGVPTPKTRLTYASPTELGIDPYILSKVDSTANNAINIGALPGCQILAAKDGHIFYHKQFGYHTYDSLLTVQSDDVYDLASLTKILATTISLVKLVDEGQINLDGKVSDYLLFLRNSNKKDLGFKEVLTHQSGLKNWIPYFEQTLVADVWDTAIYRSRISEEFPVRVANNMYIREKYNHHIMQQILDSELLEKEYSYSDLGFYLMKLMVEHLTNTPFDDYVYDNFYSPLGTNKLRFKPRKFFGLKQIIPTEDDKVFRHQLLHGDVHDQGAAMLGGVSGHAGLFGNAYDVAVVMQMIMDGGTYGNREFLSTANVNKFNTVYFHEDDNRRGLGFDKPLLEFEEHRSNCRSASPSSFGHSGFTGTYTWADPENGLVYVFLSNRIFPDMHNNKISQLDIRTNIHQMFYDAIGQN